MEIKQALERKFLSKSLPRSELFAFSKIKRWVIDAST
jgi:hypothetical protein